MLIASFEKASQLNVAFCIPPLIKVPGWPGIGVATRMSDPLLSGEPILALLEIAGSILVNPVPKGAQCSRRTALDKGRK